jgi:putative endonuclease
LRYLKRRGLRLIKQNHRCRDGEIDLIMQDRDTLVFVEVRLRASAAYGGALASVNSGKQHRVSRCAQRYLAALPQQQQNQPCRFDVVSVEAGAIEWIQDAWRPNV